MSKHSNTGDYVTTAITVCLSTRAINMLERYSKAWGVTPAEALERVVEEMSKQEEPPPKRARGKGRV